MFEIYHDTFTTILPDNAAVKQLCTGAVWAEVPVWIPAEDAVIFSDVKANRMWRYKDGEGMRIFREPSNYANGNYLDRQGRLVSCEHGRRCISRTETDGRVTILVDRFEGKRLNSPNDLVVKSDHSIWFTDPPYGILSDAEGYKSESQIIGCWIYRFDPQSNRLTVAATDVQRPNGLAFSPDERLLYVADMSIIEFPTQGRRHIVAYDVVDGYRLANQRMFAEIEPGIPDGFRVDRQGWIFTSCEDGILVLDSSGKKIGKINIPECVSNCTFGGSAQNRLYITAATSLYMIELNTRGVQYTATLNLRT